MLRYQLVAGAAALMLAACAEPASERADEAEPPAMPDAESETGETTEVNDAPASPEAAAGEAAEAWPYHRETRDAIAAEDFHYRIEALADDRFEGRAPADDKGELAAGWIAEEMARAGLEPAGIDGTWFQPVPLLESTLREEDSRFDITVNGEAMNLALGADAVYWTQNPEEEVVLEGSELVFVGYGIVAPEYGWNDYEGLDMAGKTAVILVNDPGFANPQSDRFNGRAMTYYGRWTYKYEEAARQGAEGAIIVHQTEPASYPWEVVYSSWSGAQFGLQREGDLELVDVQSWIQLDTARALFEQAGLDFDALAEDAAQEGFEAMALPGATLDATLMTDLRRLTSDNVVGRLAGDETADEHIILMAHWDHLGQRLNFAGEDQTYNGAVDNATGVAMILEQAEALAAMEDGPDRSILLLAVTAEESGLLGSQWYAENPIIPLDKTVAGFNFDAMLPVGETNDILVIGYGASELEDRLQAELDALGRYITPDRTPEAGFFYRSDHVTLARKGVPMLYTDNGWDHVERGESFGEQRSAAYVAEAYHKPADEYDGTWDVSGMVADGQVMNRVILDVANSDDWPNWYEGNEFRALRDAMMEETE